jgi:hypothetical protein
MQSFTRRRFVRKTTGAATVVAAGAGLRFFTRSDDALAQTTSGPVIPFGRNGTLSASTGTLPFVAPSSMTISGFWVACGTAPTGAAIIVDVLKNGSTLWPTNPANRPEIAPGNTKGASLAVPDITALAAGDVLMIAVVQVGSKVPGADLGLSMVVA